MPTHLDRSSLTAAGPSLMPTGLSPVRCRLATRVTIRQLLSSGFICPTPTGLPLPTSDRVEISSPNPLSGFTLKQKRDRLLGGPPT